jgi:PIF1-like helicase
MPVGPDQSSFANWQLEIGNGNANSPINSVDCVLSQPSKAKTINQLIDSVFGQAFGPSNPDYVNKAVLRSHNEYSRKVNSMILTRLERPVSTYLSADCPVDESESTDAIFSIKFLHLPTPTGLPPHNLQLKRGLIVVLLRNLSINKGLCNGTRLFLLNSGQQIIIGEILVGNKKGEFFMIPRITLNSP